MITTRFKGKRYTVNSRVELTNVLSSLGGTMYAVITQEMLEMIMQDQLFLSHSATDAQAVAKENAASGHDVAVISLTGEYAGSPQTFPGGYAERMAQETGEARESILNRT